MNGTVPGTDVLWTVLSAIGFTLALCFAASWLIDNALLPALRGLAGGLLRPWSERRWPAEGSHRRDAAEWPHPLDEEAAPGAPAHTPTELLSAKPDGPDPTGPLVSVEPLGDDLATDDDYDTDTLRVFREANAEHLVPTGEPTDPPGPADSPQGTHSFPGDRLDVNNPPETGPGDLTVTYDAMPLDTLDRMIEAVRQQTVADPMLFDWIREALGKHSVDCYMDSMRRKLAGAGAA